HHAGRHPSPQGDAPDRSAPRRERPARAEHGAGAHRPEHPDGGRDVGDEKVRARADERSLDADLGLALALDAQAGLREDLRILVMSATLDGARVAKLLGDAPTITSEGRAHPVETRHLGRDPNRRIDEQMADAILLALRAETGSVLAFLPGQGEIRRVERILAERIGGDVDLAPLYGAMEGRAQDRAIEPAPPGRRKVVLATSIAETSLTIEGVRVVVDSGLARVPRYEADIGVTRLETVRASRAAADQRRGRAGRTEPGICYRLWDEAATTSLPPFAEPEIKAADLSGLLLDLAQWGVSDPASLKWLDQPPMPALTEARAELLEIGAIDADGRITPAGKAMHKLPLPPRLARMVSEAGRRGAAHDAALIAAVLVERGLGGDSADLDHRLENFRRDRSQRAEAMSGLARGWAAAAKAGTPTSDMSAAEILALAYPSRIAKARGAPGQFLLANGRAAQVEPGDALAKQAYLVVAEMTGRAAATRILLAAALPEDRLERAAEGQIGTAEEVTFDAAARALRARSIRRLRAITLKSGPLAVPTTLASAETLARGAAEIGIAALPWTKAQIQWRDRVMFLRASEGDEWPDVSDAGLATTVDSWLAPHLVGETSLASIGGDRLDAALKAMLPWDMQRRLEAEAPTHFEAPTGSRHAIDYEGEGAPNLAIRVQELFGLKEHPAIARGRLKLTLHLLSPAQRPIQITRDLPGFWKGSWAAVKTDMKGRYPRHVWPDDPANATPTMRAKPRGT
ncbi:MAG: ATP-dependent helicase HrpB, partial [Beijerinckiaceae bacterium]|nr:ATP-dependent helicase HrpB [Beijerinckiaceae bacterium]